MPKKGNMLRVPEISSQDEAASWMLFPRRGGKDMGQELWTLRTPCTGRGCL